MGSSGIVAFAPCFDNDLRMSSAVEPVHGQTFIPELAVKALAIPVLPWTARRDVGGVGT